MLFQRQIERYLSHWKMKPNRKPLIIRGARQVGKTTLVKKFSLEFDVFISLNLEKANDKAFFDGTDEVKIIFDAIILERNIRLTGSQTVLLFLDEVQQSVQAIKLLRYFYEELPELYVIAAGSLLEFALGGELSFPVGRVEQVLLHPMSFNEYLLAIGKKGLLDRLDALDFSEATYPVFFKEFTNYIVTGGMPEAINQYINDAFSFRNLAGVFENIWISYLDDTLKYGVNENNKKVLRFILETTPFQLDRFSFASFGQQLYKSREIAEAFRQLERARILTLIYPTTSLSLPLIPDFSRRPRLQFLDTGLLLFINKKSTDFLLNKNINDQFRGQIFQHIAIQEQAAQSNSLLQKTIFWVRENADANAEIDLLLEWQGKPLPVEIKSGHSGRLRSLHEFIDRSSCDTAVRLLANQYSVETVRTPKGNAFKLINLPIFASSKVQIALEKELG